MTADPMAILGQLREKYKRLWDADEEPVEYKWEEPVDELPQIPSTQLREASLSFSRKTTSTYDGLHVRHYALVHDDGLDALSKLLAAIEVAGRWPTQMKLTTMTLIEKRQGGHRAIGKMPSLYRLWSKARRPYAAEWEAANERPFFAASAGVGPADAVYRQALKQEAGIANGLESIVILDDLEAFYESISRERLLTEARALGFPVSIVRASLAAYVGPRMLTMEGKAAKELYPKKGLVAGCSFATTFVNMFYLRNFDELAKTFEPGIQLELYIDDIAISAEAAGDSIASKVIGARESMVKCVTEDLGCTIAPGKSCLVASSAKAARNIATHLGLEHAIKRSAPNLGIDATAGGKRSRLVMGSRRRARFRKGEGRRIRLRAVAKILGNKTVKLFVAGIAPEVNFGAEVWGVSDAEAVRLRRMAAAALKPRSRCRSLTLLHILYDAPTAGEEIRTVIHYAKQIWRAATDRKRATARGMSLPEVRQRWEAAYKDIEGTVKDYIDSMEKNNGTANPAVARKAWGEVRGPVGAAALTLARYGWRFDSALVLKDARGEEIALTKNSPAMVKALLTEAVKDSLEKKVGGLWKHDDESFDGRRICPDFVKKFLKEAPRKDFTAMQIGAMRAAFCNGIYTRHRAVQNGYDVEDICPRCGACGDTVHHRTFKCPATRSAVLDHVPSWLYEEGGRADPAAKFWSTGAFPHPADIWPQPHGSFTATWHRGGGDEEHRHDDGEEESGFGGRIYTDGSSVPNVIRGLARAACAGVEVNEEGVVVRAFTMPIPRNLPQTSQASEFVGLATTKQLTTRRACISSDCANVVKTANAPLRAALAPARRYAGIALDSMAHDRGGSTAAEVRWVKAHRAESGKESAASLRDIRGNAAADMMAREAVKDHPQPTAEQRAELDYYAKRAPLICKALAAALSTFPPSENCRMTRKPKPKDEADAKDRQLHWWTFEEDMWRCRLCGTWSTAGEVPDKLKSARCEGHIAVKEAGLWTSRGHKIVVARGAAPFAFCCKCGAWGNRRALKLRSHCTTPTAAGTAALKHIAAGRHPWRKKLARGGEAPRSEIKVVAAYDVGAHAWLGLDRAETDDVTEGNAAPRAGDVNESSGERNDMKVNADADARMTSAEAATRCREGRLHQPGAEAPHSVVTKGDRGGRAPPPAAHNETDGYGDGEDDPFGHGGCLDNAPEPSNNSSGTSTCHARLAAQGPALDLQDDGTEGRKHKRARRAPSASGDGASDPLETSCAKYRLEELRKRIAKKARERTNDGGEDANERPPCEESPPVRRKWEHHGSHGESCKPSGVSEQSGEAPSSCADRQPASRQELIDRLTASSSGPRVRDDHLKGTPTGTEGRPTEGSPQKKIRSELNACWEPRGVKRRRDPQWGDADEDHLIDRVRAKAKPKQHEANLIHSSRHQLIESLRHAATVHVRKGEG